MLSAMRDRVPKAPAPGSAQPASEGEASRKAKADRLQSRRRAIADLLRRQQAMEEGGAALQPLDYRVLSRRLRQSLSRLPEPTARSSLADLPLDLLPLAAEGLETCHFEQHGELFGLRAPDCRAEADMLLQRLRVRRRRRPPPD